MRQNIYQSDIYEAFAVHKTSETIVVSFAERKEPAPAGFSGEAMLEKTGYAYCCVRAMQNDWYVHTDFQLCLQQLKKVTAHYSRIVLYGFSMGSYGALMAARDLKAQRVIAMAPIANIHPDIDKRWISDYAELITGRSAHDLRPDLPETTEIICVYDDKGPDLKHVEDLKRTHPVVPLITPKAGHMVFQFLNGAGILGSFTRALMQENVSRSELQNQIARTRKTNAHYISALSKSLSHHKTLRYRLLQYAVRQMPDDTTLKLNFAEVTAERGQLAEAAETIRSAVVASGRPLSVPVIRALVQYAESGGSDTAIADLIAPYDSALPRSREIQLLYSRYLRHIGRLDDAFRAHEKFMKGGPFSSQGFFERGLIFEQLGLLFMAEKSYQSALHEDQTFHRARHQLARIKRSSDA
ncbi:hypothetical protein [Loktanella salsilacus]|uniref:hypothetical protein n=1 Tax=Loktanella salsilacus TaxID=195913 RepID=UPI0020B898B2|nr:hypothetical protein [Loktanella salsilacus]UTH46250.1 hypothetical protein KBK07_16470 [Loktanella salsilacus]